jgi:argininosuccinate synthase
MTSPTSVRRVVLAYSGGLDTSIIVPWLREHYGAEVICFCADLGQGDELSGLRARALASGAADCVVEDLREAFARDFLFPMLQAGAIYERARAGGPRPPPPRLHGQGQRPGAL